MNNNFKSLVVQWIIVVHWFTKEVTGSFFVVIICENFFVDVVRFTVVFYSGNYVFNFLVANKGSLNSDWSWIHCRSVKHITTAKKFFGTYCINNDIRVCTAGNHEGNSGWNVSLDKTCDYVYRRSLSCKNKVNTNGAAHCCKAGYDIFEFLSTGCHEVGKLINNNNDVWQLFCTDFLLFNFFVVVRNITNTHTIEQGITSFHFAETPLQGLEGFLWLCDYRGEQMWNIIVKLELDNLRVNKNHLYIFKASLIQNRKNQRVYTNRLSGTGCTGNQHMWSFYKVNQLGLSENIFSEYNRHGHLLPFRKVHFDDFAEADYRSVAVWNFNTNSLFSRNWRYNADRLSGKAESDVILKGNNLTELYARCRQNLEHCNNRTFFDSDNISFNIKL